MNTGKLNKANVITQLYMGFSIVFLAALLTLVFFIQITPRLTALTNQSRVATEQMRASLNLRANLNNLELAINRFEISGDDFYVIEYNAIFSSLYDQINTLGITASETGQAALDELDSGLQQVDTIFSELTEARYAEDGEQVLMLDDELYATLPGMFDALELAIDEQAQALTAFEDDLYAFQNNIYLGLGISLPLMLLASLAAALIITNRINGPLVLLAETGRALKRGDADLQAVEKLAGRGGQVGDLAADFLEMAHSSSQQSAEQRVEAETLRVKIR